jgi:ureidoglycolate hydrolase
MKYKELDRMSFMEYGQVLDDAGAKLSGTSDMHDYWDKVAYFTSEGPLVCSLLRTKKKLGTPVDEMERHLKTQEILVALKGDAVLTVAKADNSKPSPDDATIKSFLLKQGQGIMFKAGTWHALPCSVNDTCMLLVVFRENTSYSEDEPVKTDIHFAKLKQALTLTA